MGARPLLIGMPASTANSSAADQIKGRTTGDGLAGPSVLVLNRSYWPDAEATGQLLTELCEDLASDFELTVIAGQPNQNPAGVSCKSWGVDRHHGVSIRRVPHLRLGKNSLWGRAVNI